MTENEIVSRFLKEMEAYPLLKKNEEQFLAQLVEAGDKEAKDKLVCSNLRLVVSVAKKYQGHGVSLADLIQEGTLGLMKAADKYDWTKGNRFSTYATWWIRQSVGRALANQGRTMRLPINVDALINKIRRTQSAMEVELGREPTQQELADKVGISVEKLRDMLFYNLPMTSLSEMLWDEMEDEILNYSFIDRTQVPIEEEVLDNLTYWDDEDYDQGYLEDPLQ